MMFFPHLGDIKDDAGARRKLLDPAGASEWPGRGDVRIDALVHRLRVTMSARSSLESLFTIVAAVGVIVIYVGTRAVFSRLFPSVHWLFHFAGIVAVAAVVGRGLWRTRLHPNRRQVARMIIEEGPCPCCGYNFHGISGLDRPPEQHVVCPECGAAWRRWRIERVRPFASNESMKSPGRLVAKRESTGSWTITDDRGGSFRLLPPNLRVLRDEVASEAHRAAVERVRKRVRRNGLWIRALVTFSVVAIAVWFLVNAAASAVPVGGGIFGALIFISFAIAATFGNFAYSPRRFRRDLLEERLCPSCGEQLGRVPPSHDGCTVCPVCRAAWVIWTSDEQEKGPRPDERGPA